jgi:DNA mismatch endonuclease (patch repair protein)
MPTTNRAYWRPKLQRNVYRDAHVLFQLSSLGWEVFVVWECELQGETLAKIVKAIFQRGDQGADG